MMCASWRWISTGGDKPLMAVSGPSGDRHLEKFRRAAKLIEQLASRIGVNQEGSRRGQQRIFWVFRFLSQVKTRGVCEVRHFPT